MRTAGGLVLSFLFAAATALAIPASADSLLSGTIIGPDSKPMAGVTVSAKPEGGTITTTVFTDDVGRYFFPALPSGNYRVWAQAISYETAKGAVDLSATASRILRSSRWAIRSARSGSFPATSCSTRCPTVRPNRRA